MVGVAQLVEQVTLNHLVVGSNPTRPTRHPRAWHEFIMHGAGLAVDGVMDLHCNIRVKEGCAIA